MPKVFYVNWFRRTPEGGFAWPGFGENSRVVKWISERIDGTAEGVETPVGIVPTIDDLDLEGLEYDVEDIEHALSVDVDEWQAELPSIQAWFDRLDRVPEVLIEQAEGLKARLDEAR